MPSPPVSFVLPEVEAQVLAALTSAETAREGAVAVLQALAPVIEDASAALAARDRDGFTLHVLAETGAPTRWPERFTPQFALGQGGVDPGTHVGVLPLRSQGAVVGALLLADARLATTLQRDDQFVALLGSVAEVLRAMFARVEVELRRRALALRSIESVIQGMVHQMANPLTGASAIAQLLAEEITDEGQRAAMLQMHAEMKRAFTVLDDLLDLQRDTRAQDGLIDISAFVERILRFRGYTIREQGIALETSSAPVFLPVRADSRWLEHALLQVLWCAERRSHGTVNRSIAVRVAEGDAREVTITVTDSSAGDIPDVAPRYYDLPLIPGGHPAHREAGEEPDLGLVDTILRSSGGRLEVRGSKTDGTSFILVLPRAPSPTSR